MDERLISCSKDWTVLKIIGPGKNNSFHLNYFDIDSIQFDKTYIEKLFRKIPTERIRIFTKSSKDPLEFTRYRNAKYFDEYKQELIKFSKDNKIRLNDYTIS